MLRSPYMSTLKRSYRLYRGHEVFVEKASNFRLNKYTDYNTPPSELHLNQREDPPPKHHRY